MNLYKNVCKTGGSKLLDLIIKNGKAVFQDDIKKVDIGIRDGKIVLIGKNIELPSFKVEDAQSYFVLPGVIDVHTHIDHWGGMAKTEDDFYTGSRAAAFGGTTTFIDFAIQQKGENVKTAVQRRLEQIYPNSSIDYSVHAHVTDSSEETIALIPDIIQDGVPSFKMFTTYKAAGFKIEDPDILKLLKVISENGGFTMVHAENDSFCEELTSQLLQKNEATVSHYAGSRPHIAEVECISRLLLYAKQTHSKLYIVHVTTSEGVELIRQAKKEGVDVMAETCLHYLFLDDSYYQRQDGYKFVMAPPLRNQQDIEALWNGLLDGTLSIVSSDHCDYSTDKKIQARKDFTKISPGIHGIEWLFPFLYELAVNRRNIPLTKVMEWLSFNPAKTFGISHRKGKIEIGMDADLILFDPNSQRILTDKNHHMSSDFCPYEGERITGRIKKVFSNGELIIDEDTFLGEKGKGHFLKPSFQQTLKITI